MDPPIQYAHSADGASIAYAASGARDSSVPPVKPVCVASNPLATCKALHFQETADWITPTFNDTPLVLATVYTREQFGPKEAYITVEVLSGTAKFIWSRDSILDNVLLFRKTVPAAP